MKSHYLVRLDDACPTMDDERWSRLEAILDERGIQPLVAVVPDNQDPDLQINPPNPEFWNRVRAWQDKGWTIAMHGYQHRFHHVDRRELVLPFYDRSEFAGLSLNEQSEKFRLAWQIFQREGVVPEVWIAPAHCFDQTTLEALKAETPIRIVSDGLALNHFFKDDFFWLPQQTWSFAQRRSGLWTVCLHPNSMSFTDIDNLDAQLASSYYCVRTISVSDVALTKRYRSVLDNLFSLSFWYRRRIVNTLLAIRQAILVNNN